MISYAQNFEDVMLWRALRNVKNGCYIDVGAQHPVIDSVSKAFYENGWRGINVETSPAYAALLREDRPDEIIINAAVSDSHGTITFFEILETGLSTGDAKIAQEHRERGFEVREIILPCITLNDVLNHTAGTDIHWLKIDVEGLELNVLEGWGDSEVRPWIIVIESTLPLTQTDSYAEWEELLWQKNYKEVYFDGLNRFYLSSSQLHLEEAFRAGPNVFDGFSLNGTACAPFCTLLTERHKQDKQTWAKELTAAQKAIFEEQAEREKLKKDLYQQLEVLQDEKIVLGNNLTDEVRAVTERERTLRQNLQDVQENALEREKAWSERDKVLSGLLSQTSQKHHEELKGFLRGFAQREQEFGEKQLHAVQIAEQEKMELLQQHAEQEKLLRHEYDSREKNLHEEQAALLRSIAEREQEFVEKQLHAAQIAEQEKSELLQHYIEQEKLLRHEYDSREKNLHEEQAALLRSIAKREQEFVEKQLHVAQIAEQEKSELLQKYIEQEKLLRHEYESREKSLHEEQAALLRSIAEREQEFGEQHQRFIQSAERERGELLQLHAEQVKLLQQEYVRREETLRNEQSQQFHIQQQQFTDTLALHQHQYDQQKKSYADLEEQFRQGLKVKRVQILQQQQVLEALQKEMENIQSSFSWKLTEPIRKFAEILRRNTEEEAISLSLHSTQNNIASAPDKIPSDQLDMQTINNNDKVTAAKTIDELLSYYDIQFVHCAYKTLLGREPDPEGMHYYLMRLRSGINKIKILSDIRKSEEAKLYSSNHSRIAKISMQIKKANNWVYKYLYSKYRINQNYNFIDNNIYQINKKLQFIDINTIKIENDIKDVQQEISNRFDEISKMIINQLKLSQEESINIDKEERGDENIENILTDMKTSNKNKLHGDLVAQRIYDKLSTQILGITNKQNK